MGLFSKIKNPLIFKILTPFSSLKIWRSVTQTVLTFNQQPIAIQNSFGDNTICPCELTRDFIARVTAKEGFSIDLIIHSNPMEINQFFVTSLIGNILNQFCFSTSERALLNIKKIFEIKPYHRYVRFQLQAMLKTYTYSFFLLM